MPNNTGFNLADLIKNFIKKYLFEVHTVIPAKIVNLTGNGKVDVKPLVEFKGQNGDIVEMPIISDVPILFQHSSVGGISFKINVNDNVLLHASEVSIDELMSGNGDYVQTDDERRFSLTDCFATYGVFPFGGMPYTEKDQLRVIYNNCQIELNADDTIAVSNTNNSIVLNPDGSIDIGNNAKRLITETFKDIYNSHTHSIVGQATGVPILPVTDQNLTVKGKME